MRTTFTCAFADILWPTMPWPVFFSVGRCVIQSEDRTRRTLTYSTYLIKWSCHVISICKTTFTVSRALVLFTSTVTCCAFQSYDYVTLGSVARCSKSMSKPNRECPHEIYLNRVVDKFVDWEREWANLENIWNSEAFRVVAKWRDWRTIVKRANDNCRLSSECAWLFFCCTFSSQTELFHWTIKLKCDLKIKHLILSTILLRKLLEQKRFKDRNDE